MKIAIFNNHDASSQTITQALIVARERAGLTIDHERPDVVVSVGGDGTFLGAFQHYVDQIDTVRFVGLHTGHLGFYTDWLRTELPQLVASLQHDNHERVSYPVLEMTAVYDSGEQ